MELATLGREPVVCTPCICTLGRSTEGFNPAPDCFKRKEEKKKKKKKKDHYGWVVEHLQYRWSCRQMASIRCRGYNGNGVDWHLARQEDQTKCWLRPSLCEKVINGKTELCTKAKAADAVLLAKIGADQPETLALHKTSTAVEPKPVCLSHRRESPRASVTFCKVRSTRWLAPHAVAFVTGENVHVGVM